MSDIISIVSNVFSGQCYIDTFPFDTGLTRLNKFKGILETSHPSIFKMIFALHILSSFGNKYELDHQILFKLSITDGRLFIREMYEIEDNDEDLSKATELKENTTFYDWISMTDCKIPEEPQVFVKGFLDVVFFYQN